MCECGGVLKPATISFGQSLRAADLDRAADAARQADLVVALGSTLSVYPAASLPLVAAQRGTPYVIVNRGVTDHDDHPSVTLRLEGDVTVIVPPAVEAALGDASLRGLPGLTVITRRSSQLLPCENRRRRRSCAAHSCWRI